MNNTSLVDESTEDVTAKISSNTNAEMSIDVELLLESSYLYYCVMCPKTFFTLEHLNKHLRNHRLTSVQIKTVESIVHSTWWPNGEKIIKCKICEQTFKTMAKLKEHFSPSNQQQNVCANKHSLANYSITNQKGFELHLELDSETEIEDDHNNEHNRYIPIVFPYSCCICRKMFRRKYQVAQHQRSMHDYQLLELKCERCIFRTVSRVIHLLQIFYNSLYIMIHIFCFRKFLIIIEQHNVLIRRNNMNVISVILNLCGKKIWKNIYLHFIHPTK